MRRVHIYEDPPSPEVLRAMAARHPEGIRAFVSTRGTKYRELGLAERSLSDEEWFALIEREPRLLRRPILWDGVRVLVGWDRGAYEGTFSEGDGS